MKWSYMKAMPRLVNTIVHTRAEFLVRDQTPSRSEIDARDTDSYWDLVVKKFNEDGDDEIEFNFFVINARDHDVPQEVIQLDPMKREGYILTRRAAKAEFKKLRQKLQTAMNNFQQSGQGDGGGGNGVEDGDQNEVTENEREGEVFSSSFIDFVHADWPMYYAYLLFTKYSLLTSTLVEMPPESRHSCSIPHSIAPDVSRAAVSSRRDRKRSYEMSVLCDIMDKPVVIEHAPMSADETRHLAEMRELELEEKKVNLALLRRKDTEERKEETKQQQDSRTRNYQALLQNIEEVTKNLGAAVNALVAKSLQRDLVQLENDLKELENELQNQRRPTSYRPALSTVNEPEGPLSQPVTTDLLPPS